MGSIRKGVPAEPQVSPLGPTPSFPKTARVSPIFPEISEYRMQVSSFHNYQNIILEQLTYGIFKDKNNLQLLA